MSRRAQVVGPATVPGGGVGSAPPRRPGPARSPNPSGDLEATFGTAPCFRRSVRGYDPLQVDNYVAWAEMELSVARQRADELAAEFGPCLAELELSRRLLALSPEGRIVAHVSQQMEEILRVAADEAAALNATATGQAEEIVGRARIESEATLRHAHEIKDAAIAEGDRARAQAVAVLDTARADAAGMLRDAAEQRDRLAAEAAAARQQAGVAAAEQLVQQRERLRRERETAEAEDADRRARAQRELDALQRQRQEARDCLQALNERVDAALEALTGTPSGEVVVLADAS